MARTVSVETRPDLLEAIRERYRAGTKDEKLRILDEFVAVTGYHRKHAIRWFKAGAAARGASRRSRLPLYDAAVREALVVADDPRMVAAVACVGREGRADSLLGSRHDARRGDTAGRFSTRPATADISATQSSSSPSCSSPSEWIRSPSTVRCAVTRRRRSTGVGRR